MNGTDAGECLNSGCGVGCVGPQGRCHTDSEDTRDIIIILINTFIKDIHNYIPETNHVSTVYSVAAVLYLQSVLHVMLLSMLNMFCTFTSALPAVCVCVCLCSVLCNVLNFWRRNYFFLILARPVYKI